MLPRRSGVLCALSWKANLRSCCSSLVYGPCLKIATALSGVAESAFRPSMGSWCTELSYCTTLMQICVFRGSLPVFKSSLIPFGAIILSPFLNGRDSIIPLIAHNPIGLQTRERQRTPPEPLLLVSARKISLRVRPYDECVYGSERLLWSSEYIGIPHATRGL